ncbi:hypothetical protein DMA11_07565 [Marinilabiliaceae bacterium JC017]|nr:hypothetical protein DMA11_07565 [Marinilabiliaceae bacterium JC017]
MNKMLALILVMVAVSCTNTGSTKSNGQNEIQQKVKNNSVKKEIANKDFEKFLNQLDFLEIPNETSCFNSYKSDNAINQELSLKFSENNMEYPYKRIGSSKEYECVMFLVPADVLVPIIRTYDLNGKIIATEPLFLGACGGEPGYFHKEYFQIKSEKVITHIDSTWTCEIDEDYNDIAGTDKLEVKTYDIVINSDGTIAKQE